MLGDPDVYDLEPRVLQQILAALEEGAASQGIAVSASIGLRLIRGRHPALTEDAVGALLAGSGRFRETSPGMYRPSRTKDDRDERIEIQQIGPTSGQSIEAMLARFDQLEGNSQVRAFKKLAALDMVRRFDNREAALASLNKVLDDGVGDVLIAEGWSLRGLHAAATDGEPVAYKKTDDASLMQRHLILAAVQAVELVRTSTPDRLRDERRRLVDLLVMANIRLVGAIAEPFARARFLRFGDLFDEGVLGLLTAVAKFDPFRGFTFSTYATAWIRQAITRAMADKERTIRLPVHAVEELNALRRKETATDLAASTNADQAQPGEGIDDRIQHMVAADAPVVPIDDVRDEQIDQAMRPDGDEVFESATASMMRDDLALALKDLPAQWRQVLELRFGFLDGRERTLEEIGREFNLTRERIRQIEVRALKQLRTPDMCRRIRGYDPSTLDWSSLVLQVEEGAFIAARRASRRSKVASPLAQR